MSEDTIEKKIEDVTVNWRVLNFEHKGVFYTDSNSYRIIKRNVDPSVK